MYNEFMRDIESNEINIISEEKIQELKYDYIVSLIKEIENVDILKYDIKEQKKIIEIIDFYKSNYKSFNETTDIQNEIESFKTKISKIKTREIKRKKRNKTLILTNSIIALISIITGTTCGVIIHIKCHPIYEEAVSYMEDGNLPKISDMESEKRFA